MDADGGVYGAGICLGKFHGLPGMGNVGSRYDEFLAADGSRALDHIGEVRRVLLLAVVRACVDRVSEVDAYLRKGIALLAALLCDLPGH